MVRLVVRLGCVSFSLDVFFAGEVRYMINRYTYHVLYICIYIYIFMYSYIVTL